MNHYWTTSIGLLNPRYIYDPGEFIKTFEGLSYNQSTYNRFLKQIIDKKTIVLICGDQSMLNEVLLAVENDSSGAVSAGNIGLFKFLIGEPYQFVYIIGSPSLIPALNFIFRN